MDFAENNVIRPKSLNHLGRTVATNMSFFSSPNALSMEAMSIETKMEAIIRRELEAGRMAPDDTILRSDTYGN
jgi:hypothetical protein